MSSRRKLGELDELGGVIAQLAKAKLLRTFGSAPQTAHSPIGYWRDLGSLQIALRPLHICALAWPAAHVCAVARLGTRY
jgi:hypothetical protein